jgi:spore germination protein GerM
MTRRYALLVGGFVLIIAIVGVVRLAVAPRWARTSRTGATAPAPAAPATPGRKIKARLFYVADDGARLTGVEREVAYGEGAVDQAREIVQAQIAAVSEPMVSPIPPATKLRAVFLTERGEAFVDLSSELATGHTGGSTDEMLTVYAIVNALTANLPAIKSVQILVNGKQIETLAGHVDLRRPLAQDLAWVQ